MAETRESIQRQLNCPICLETFESPKVLMCLHTFCEKCICRHARSLKEAETQSDIITCPICRNPTPAPATDQTEDEWAAKLASNSIILSLLESTQTSKEESVYCQPCLTLGKQNISVAYCVTCSEYLCSNCYSCHKSFKMSKDHSITVHSVSEEQNWNKSQDMYRCSVHRKQYKYFCSSHNELCCSDCAFRDHRKCDEVLLVMDLSERTEERQDFKQVSEQLDEAKTMFTTLLESTSKIIDSIEQQKIAITKSIQDWTITIKELIDRLETAALNELNQMCKQENIKASDQIVECKSAIAAIETSEEMLMGSRKAEDDKKIFITTTKVYQQVLKYLEKYKAMENNAEIVELEFHFDSTCEGIIQTLSSIGKLTRRAIKVPKLSTDSLFAKTKIPTIQPNSKMVTFSAKIRNDYYNSNISSGVFLFDERLVLCDRANNKLKLFDRYFQFVSDLKMKSNTRYICLVDESTVAVTVDRDIKLVSVTNKLTPLRCISVGKDCYGIASYQQNIVVHVHDIDIETEIIEESLLTYDTSGKIISEIQSDYSVGWHNTHCVDPDGQRIYYTTKNSVVTMDMKGNKLNTFESNDLKGVSGIIIDKQGIIYCCGTESKTVIMVTPEGRQLGVLLSLDHRLEKPRCICLNDKNDTILVFAENSNDVKVFQIC